MLVDHDNGPVLATLASAGLGNDVADVTELPGGGLNSLPHSWSSTRPTGLRWSACALGCLSR
jgi:hypothetical protein